MMAKLHNKKGFTFIEVIITIFLLSIVLLGLANINVMSIKYRSLSKTITTATTLAQEKMEELKNTTYSSLSGANGTDYATIDSVVQTTQAGSFFKRSWTVTAGSGYMEVSVSITWTWLKANDHTLTFNTRIAKTG